MSVIFTLDLYLLVHYLRRNGWLVLIKYIWYTWLLCLYFIKFVMSENISSYYFCLPALCFFSSGADGSSSRRCSDWAGPGDGPGSDPAAEGALWAAGPAGSEPSGPAKESLSVSGRFQHHYPAFLYQGRLQQSSVTWPPPGWPVSNYGLAITLRAALNVLKSKSEWILH